MLRMDTSAEIGGGWGSRKPGIPGSSLKGLPGAEAPEMLHIDTSAEIGRG